MPTYAHKSSRFIAYFCEQGRWYRADDSEVTTTEMNGAPPRAFAYMCILERLDLDASMPWPPILSAPQEKATSDDTDDEDAPMAKRGQDAPASASASCSNPPILQTPQASRAVKRPAHPTSPRSAGQNLPTPKRHRLVGKQVPPYVWSDVQSSGQATPSPKTLKLCNAVPAQQH